jgi:hypothetical protein
MNRAPLTRVVRAFRRAVLPLTAYYGVTLALPLANGAASSIGGFSEHALVVLAVPPLVIVLICAVHTIGRAAACAARPWLSRT